MPLWTFGNIDEEPEVRLVRWRVLEVTYVDGSAPTRHFVGAEVADRTGRVSSAVAELDAAARRGRTQSGRAYELIGAPNQDNEAEYVWNMWCHFNGVDTWVDVTKQAFTAADGKTPDSEVKP